MASAAWPAAHSSSSRTSRRIAFDRSSSSTSTTETLVTSACMMPTLAGAGCGRDAGATPAPRSRRHAVEEVHNVNANDLLIEAFGRLPTLVRSAVEGLTPDQLHWSPAPRANSIGWLIWHLTRIQDHHVAELVGQEQVWVSGDWA